ncbi:MAG: DUF4177 domain-containing protein [Oscillospiraceae bacterium]|jgi:hypothetical protein|nr:DUF4177 domain-containing protein [Oscillospiraceae bacterium]
MDKWEYKTLHFETKGFTGGVLNAEEVTERLNGWGAQGWEVVSAFDTNQAYGASRFVFVLLKRKLEA